MAAWYAFVASSIFGMVAWAFRLEGKVQINERLAEKNIELADQKLGDLKELINTKFDAVSLLVNSRFDMIERSIEHRTKE